MTLANSLALRRVLETAGVELMRMAEARAFA
jgi:hypothetical protein